MSTFSQLQSELFFLTIPIDSPEYMRILYLYIPADIRELYNLDEKVAEDG